MQEKNTGSNGDAESGVRQMRKWRYAQDKAADQYDYPIDATKSKSLRRREYILICFEIVCLNTGFVKPTAEPKLHSENEESGFRNWWVGWDSNPRPTA